MQAHATCQKRRTCHLQKCQPITRTSLRGPEGTAFTDEEPEQLGLVGQHPDGVAEALPRGELRFGQL
jgi:hypothetical protein